MDVKASVNEVPQVQTTQTMFPFVKRKHHSLILDKKNKQGRHLGVFLSDFIFKEKGHVCLNNFGSMYYRQSRETFVMLFRKGLEQLLDHRRILP